MALASSSAQGGRQSTTPPVPTAATREAGTPVDASCRELPIARAPSRLDLRHDPPTSPRSRAILKRQGASNAARDMRRGQGLRQPNNATCTVAPPPPTHTCSDRPKQLHFLKSPPPKLAPLCFLGLARRTPASTPSQQPQIAPKIAIAVDEPLQGRRPSPTCRPVRETCAEVCLTAPRRFNESRAHRPPRETLCRQATLCRPQNLVPP